MVETCWNIPLRLVPRAATETMMTIAMSATINPYSTAVAHCSAWIIRSLAIAVYIFELLRDRRGEVDQTLVETFWNRPLRLVPRAATATMMTIAMRATMRPYSTAVAPFSERRF